MNRLLLALSLILFSGLNLTAGTPTGSFIVVSNGTATDVAPYTAAVANADMESFRYQDQRCVIEFDNGVKIELLSAQEMQAMGLPVTVSDYKTTDTANWIQPIFHLNADGTLSAMYTKPNLKQNSSTH